MSVPAWPSHLPPVQRFSCLAVPWGHLERSEVTWALVLPPRICKSSPQAILKCTQSECTVLLHPFSPQLSICPSRSTPQLAPSPAEAEIIKSDLVVFRTLIPKLPDVRITEALIRIIQTHLSIAIIL